MKSMIVEPGSGLSMAGGECSWWNARPNLDFWKGGCCTCRFAFIKSPRLGTISLRSPDNEPVRANELFPGGNLMLRIAGFAVLGLALLCFTAVHADDKDKAGDKEVKLTGKITCAKCDLKKEKAC